MLDSTIDTGHDLGVLIAAVAVGWRNRMVDRAAGVREATVSLGVDELGSDAEPLGRARAPGGGRKRAADVDPGLRPALLALVEPEERGDPMSLPRRTTKSARNLAAGLTRQGHQAGADTAGELLGEEGFSLQGSAKTTEGGRHPRQDAQFRCINAQVKDHQATADPMISAAAEKRSWPGTSPARAGSGGPRASPRPPARMTSPGTARARSSRTGPAA